MAPKLTSESPAPAFKVGDLVQHRASKRAAVVLKQWLNDDGEVRYFVEWDFIYANGEMPHSCECGEIILETAS